MKKSQSKGRSATASIRGAILRSRNAAATKRATSMSGGEGISVGGEVKPRV